ncbi:MAG: glycosyltransferase family 4 protein [Halobacteriota archaeon]
MKITFILPGIGLYGGVRVVFEYANRLKDRGHEVNVIYPLIPPQIKPKFSLKSLTSQALGAIENLKKGNKVSWFDLKAKLIRVPTLSPRYAKFVEKLIPDADIVVATSWKTAYPVNKLNEKKGKKFYFVQHYEIWDIWNDEECWKEVEKIESNPNKLCLAMRDIIPENKDLKRLKGLVDKTYTIPLKKITISSWLKELIERKFGEKVEALIINGVNFDIFYKKIDAHSKEKIIVLMPYRHIGWKGTEDGLKALKIVKKKYPNVEFIMYGTKRRKDIPEWVNFYEKISDNELRQLYSSSDIFVLPSWVEGCQLPPMEAMACGCAVVATNVGGIPDYSINGENILASPPRNIKALAQNIIRLIEDEQKRRKIAENGYNHIKQFTWDKATDELEKVFEKYI